MKVFCCPSCNQEFDLFPGYLLADDTRHPVNVLVCSKCGELNEVADLKVLGNCKTCQSELKRTGPASRNQCRCPHCGHVSQYQKTIDGPPKHRLFAIEYYNPYRKTEHVGRFFKKPDEADLKKVETIKKIWQATSPSYVPDEEILPGDETDRLHRWGYRRYRELFNERQLLGLEMSAELISEIPNERIRNALSTNFSDLLRYQNMLCRFDTMALKSLDIFSVHGFPVGLVQCESNILGITNHNQSLIGSGGWRNIIEKYVKAKIFCDHPFEVLNKGSKKVKIPMDGEWIGESKNGKRTRRVDIRCISSTEVDLAPGSLDAVFTDPPYYGNVQYGELMDFCYVWLRR